MNTKELNRTTRKAENRVQGAPRELAERVLTLGRMVRAYANGSYRVVPRTVIAAAICALLYVANPFDLAFDFWIGVGLLDDAIVVAGVFGAIASEIERFRAWELGLGYQGSADTSESANDDRGQGGATTS